MCPVPTAYARRVWRDLAKADPLRLPGGTPDVLELRGESFDLVVIEPLEQAEDGRLLPA